MPDSAKTFWTASVKELLGPFCGEIWSFFLLHDNAPTRTAAIVTQFLTRKMVPVLDHSPVFPRFKSSRLFPVPEVEVGAQGDHHFVTIETIQVQEHS